MIPVSKMNTRVRFYTRADDSRDSVGAVRESWTADDYAWAHISAPSETTRRIQNRYASPVSLLMTCYPHASCVAGGRVRVGGVMYSILGVDATGAVYHADLGEVV